MEDDKLYSFNEGKLKKLSEQELRRIYLGAQNISPTVFMPCGRYWFDVFKFRMSIPKRRTMPLNEIKSFVKKAGDFSRKYFLVKKPGSDELFIREFSSRPKPRGRQKSVRAAVREKLDLKFRAEGIKLGVRLLEIVPKEGTSVERNRHDLLAEKSGVQVIGDYRTSGKSALDYCKFLRQVGNFWVNFRGLQMACADFDLKKVDSLKASDYFLPAEMLPGGITPEKPKKVKTPGRKRGYRRNTVYNCRISYTGPLSGERLRQWEEMFKEAGGEFQIHTGK
jgi:hypothetical protein